MFKNNLFFKLILIFTLPILGMLSYTAYLTYQKDTELNQVYKLYNDVEYTKIIKELIFSLEKEKYLASKYFLLQKESSELEKEYQNTNELFKKLNENIAKLSIESKIKYMDYDLDKIIELREKLPTSNITLSYISDVYSEAKKNFISLVFFASHFKYLNNTNIDISKIIEYLSKDENSKYTKDFLVTLIDTIEKDTQLLEDKIKYERNGTILFLFITFMTMISLFFVLRNIITKEQNIFKKIQSYKDIYEIINKTNKFLVKTYDKKGLYHNVCEILTDNENFQFAFIYDTMGKTILAKDGRLKEKIITQSDKYRDETHENLVSKTIKWQSNIIINDFNEKNLSVFYEEAKELNINSMATFPIKEFDNVVAVLIVYSKTVNFFDKEVEVLVDKLVNDITHCLEKIEYESLRLKQEDELRLSSYAFDTAEPMLITDKKGEIIKVNQAFCSIMGYSKDEIIGKNPRMFKTPHQDAKFIDDLWSELKINGFWSGEVYNRKSNDEIIPLRSTITAIKNKSETITHYLGQYFDIGKIKDKEKILEYQATHDNLTGLPNRLLLADRIEQATRKIVRHKIIGGLIFIDLDNFKMVNDTLGHDVGDVLLITVAKKIKEVIREEDTVSRIGGDEFVILLDNLGNTKDDARRNIIYLAEKIKATLNGITHIEGHKNISTPSIGITLFNDSSVSVRDLIKQADTAMYVAKKQGKNSIELFED